MIALHKAIYEIVKPNIEMQIKGEDVAIPILLGKPGGGKTAMIKNLTDYNVVATHIGSLPIEEMSGIPKYVEKNGELYTIWSISAPLSKVIESSKEKPTIWFLDDIHLGDASVIKLVQEIMTERSLKGHKIPVNVAIVGAGNDSNKAGFRGFLSSIINRISIIKVYTDFDYWKSYAVNNDVNKLIISFLSSNMYNKYFHTEENVTEPWASPRSWTRLSNFLNYNNKILANPEICMEIVASHVGDETASDFISFIEKVTKVDAGDIFNNIDNLNIKKENFYNKYIISAALLMHFLDNIGKNKNAYIKKMIEIIGVFLDDAPELGISMIKDINAYNNSIANIIIGELLNNKKFHEAIKMMVI